MDVDTTTPKKAAYKTPSPAQASKGPHSPILARQEDETNMERHSAGADALRSIPGKQVWTEVIWSRGNEIAPRMTKSNGIPDITATYTDVSSSTPFADEGKIFMLRVSGNFLLWLILG